MQISSKTVRHGIRGFALIITLILMGVMLTIFGSIMYYVSSNSKVTLRNNQYNMSQSAAEAAVEKVLSQMDRDFLYNTISNASSYYSLVPDTSTWPVQYNFSDTNGNVGRISLDISATTNTVLNSQYKGLFALARNCTLVAIATPTNQPTDVSAKITETVQFANIDIFQFAIFYNVNLEVAPGAAMTIGGSVFCNQSIWEGSSLTTYSNTVSAVGTNCTLAADPFANNYTKSSGAVFSLSGQPTDGNDALVMPIGTNNNPNTVRAILDWPPATYAFATAAAYSTNGQKYPANEADLIITNAFYGTNFGAGTPKGTNNTVIYFQDSAAVSYLTWVTNDFYIMSNRLTHTLFYTNFVPTTGAVPAPNVASNIIYAGYSFITNDTFVDWREGWSSSSTPTKTVQAVQIDVGKLYTWMTNSLTNSAGAAVGGAWYNNKCVNDKGRWIGGVYVYNYVLPTSTTLPAVRLVNGQKVPSTSGANPYGFTVATPFPMYVQGNYNVQTNGGTNILGLINNTASTYPAALMADSITILSTSWDDSVDASKMVGASSTTINAAMLEGIVQTDPTISGDYSGGVENFMRLLEDWSSGPVLTYNGSIVVMFYSQYATNHWQNTGNYYNAPSRNWAFDTNFKQASKLPPMTPRTLAIIRGQWIAQ